MVSAVVRILKALVVAMVTIVTNNRDYYKNFDSNNHEYFIGTDNANIGYIRDVCNRSSKTLQESEKSNSRIFNNLNKHLSTLS